MFKPLSSLRLESIKKYTTKMEKFYEGKILIKNTELNLDLTLLGGQSFRWDKASNENEWQGVAYDAYWILTQNTSAVNFKVYPAPDALNNATKDAKFYSVLLGRYFRTDFDLLMHIGKWRDAHDHFKQIASNMKAVRVLDQEPLENIISFICSQNNHIKRISNMVNWFCEKYGSKIGEFNGRNEYTFPCLDELMKHQKVLETEMREAKFGYRAKFISQTINKIAEFGGTEWLTRLRKLPYNEARLKLTTLPGIGFKVADCICLMSLNHLESVPIDTHIYKIAQQRYMIDDLAKLKSVTPKIYEYIANHFRNVYGPFAGWAQAVLFCSNLQKFQSKNEGGNSTSDATKPKRKKKT